MRLLSLLAAAVLLALSMGHARADDGKEATLETEFYFRNVYSVKPSHKAFAVARDGGFSAQWGWESSRKAASKALTDCRNNYARNNKTGEKDSQCRVVAIDGKVLDQQALTDPGWQKAATGEDAPLAKAFVSRLFVGKPRGIILAVHGCDGLGSETYNTAWGSFFNSLGYDFYMPNSFAESRPRQVCGNDAVSGRHLVSKVFRLRQAQTLRTIARLEADHPGVPIILWGHSEGGFIVQSLKADVSSIIVTGEECDVYDFPIAAPAKVPVLYVLGENDAFVDGFKLPLTKKALRACGKYMGRRKWAVAVVKDNDHVIYPWRKTAAMAIAKFLGVEYREIASFPAGSVITPTAEMETNLKHYAVAPGHRAFAANPKGGFAWVQNWGHAEDAAQAALFQCASRNGFDVFALRKHHCALVDLDGKAPVREGDPVPAP